MNTVKISDSAKEEAGQIVVEIGKIQNKLTVAAQQAVLNNERAIEVEKLLAAAHEKIKQLKNENILLKKENESLRDVPPGKQKKPV